MEELYLKQTHGNFEQFAEIIKRESSYFIADEVPFWCNGKGYTNGRRGRLFLYQNGEVTQLSEDDINICDVQTYRQEYGLFYGNLSRGIQKTEGRLYYLDYQNMNIIPIDETDTYIYTCAQPVDSDHILVCRNDKRLHGEYQDEYIDLIDLRNGTFLRNNQNSDLNIYDNVLTDITYLTGWLNKITVLDKNKFLFIATIGGSSKLCCSQFGKEEVSEITGEGKVLDYVVEEDGIYLIAMRGISGPEFYYKKTDGGEELRLTDLNTGLEKEYAYVKPERCDFLDREGNYIEGWVMKPTVFDVETKYPTILFIHGGPNCAYGAVFTHEMQVMCSLGYGVIYCNPRGSEGRGGDFADIRQRWGTIDYDDLMMFVDTAIHQHSWIDENRLGVTGGSYGGIAVNWIIGHTRRFKAAVSDRSVSNLFSDIGMSDIGFSCNKDTYGVTPWEDPKYIWEQSTLKYAPDIKTPVLFIHGMEDFRCTFDHSLQLHSAITYFGGTSKVFGFKGENHELCRSGSPQNRKRRIEEMTTWFNRYLKEEK